MAKRRYIVNHVSGRGTIIEADEMPPNEGWWLVTRLDYGETDRSTGKTQLIDRGRMRINIDTVEEICDFIERP